MAESPHSQWRELNSFGTLGDERFVLSYHQSFNIFHLNSEWEFYNLHFLFFFFFWCKLCRAFIRHQTYTQLIIVSLKTIQLFGLSMVYLLYSSSPAPATGNLSICDGSTWHRYYSPLSQPEDGPHTPQMWATNPESYLRVYFVERCCWGCCCSCCLVTQACPILFDSCAIAHRAPLHMGFSS